jgi:hypothetical protein
MIIFYIVQRAIAKLTPAIHNNWIVSSKSPEYLLDFALNLCASQQSSDRLEEVCQ